MKKLLLASSSQSRKTVLQQTGISFESLSPNIDETFRDKSPDEYVLRLSKEKALQGWNLFQEKYPEKKIDCVLGSDQIAVFKNKIYGKPKDLKEAAEFLKLFSGQRLIWYAGLAVFFPEKNTIFSQFSQSKVVFEALTENLIQQYLTLDQPLSCAGALKIEGLGTSLIKSFSSDDPTGIIGLPLVLLNNLLKEEGFSLCDFKKTEN